MKAQEYIDFLAKRLAAHFDFADTRDFLPFELDLFAVYQLKSEKYFFTKKINLYNIQNDAYFLVKKITAQTGVREIETYCDRLIAYLPDMLHITAAHMSSVVTLAFISETAVPEDLAAFIAQKKYHKDFMFTLKGWADLGLVAVDLEKRQVYGNKFAKKTMKNYPWFAKAEDLSKDREFL